MALSVADLNKIAEARKLARDGDEKGEGKDPELAEMLWSTMLGETRNDRGDRAQKLAAIAQKRAAYPRGSKADLAFDVLVASLSEERVRGQEPAVIRGR